LGGAKTLSYG